MKDIEQLIDELIAEAQAEAAGSTPLEPVVCALHQKALSNWLPGRCECKVEATSLS